jgi:hypothetical protein
VTSRREKIFWGAVASVATLGLAVALGTRPGEKGPGLEAYVLFLGAVAVTMLARATHRAFPAPTSSRVAAALARRRRMEPRLPELARLEREVEMSLGSAYDTYYRLRPALREIAAGRLARSGVELDAGDGRAKTLLGPDVWALVRPDLVRPEDHHAPGATLAEVERALDALEALGR